MSKENSGSDNPRRPAETGSRSIEESVRSSEDRADDPLFVPRIEPLELTSERLDGGVGDDYAALLETICGANDDSQPVEQYNGALGVTTAFVAAHQSAACQVQWNSNLASIYTNPGDVSGARWGSGTMITNDLFLTCGHLFDQTGGGWQRPRQNGTSNIISPQEIARNMHLNFNFQVDPAGNLRPEQSFAIVELIEYRLGGLDMAICRIAGNPGATFGRGVVSTTDAVVPEMLCIIGHPAGRPKRIEAGPTTRLAGNLIHYGDIDTLGGNSGSGILRARDGRLVGIHTNGGCTRDSPGDGGTNFGQRIAAVIAASPTLRALVAPKNKLADDPVTVKFRDDVGNKRKVLDDIAVTLKFRDDVVAKRKVLDDLTLSKPPALEGKPPGADNPGNIGDRPRPFGESPGAGGQPARPFILGTPHHSNAWGGEGQQAEVLGQIEHALMQLEQAMAAGEAELMQLDAEYRQLLAEYEAAGGNLGG
ncbi:MAG TPA: trypsin-like peptidase domain-containing protein [Pyrinomonadaceae bacterium]|jgi:V8-like Glu-specific endopeptidase